MPQPLTSVPDPLRGRAFTVREGLQHGLGRNTLRHPRFESPFKGVRVHRESSAPHSLTLEDRVRIFVPLLRRGEAFSHVTALQLLGCPIRAGENELLHVTVPAPRNPRRAAGVRGHQVGYAFESWVRSDGVEIVPPILAVAQSAAILPLREIVVAMDSLVLPRRQNSSLLDLTTLADGIQRHSGRGSRNLRRALSLARLGAESRMETLLRLVLEAFELAEHFELQVNLSDEAGWIGRFDLVCERRRLILEYDGEQHRTDRGQYLKDLRRLDRARDAGYRLLRVHAGELLSDPAQIARSVAGALGVEWVREPRYPELLR